MTREEFYKRLSHVDSIQSVDKALLILWFEGKTGGTKELSASQLSKTMRDNGIGNPNQTILAKEIQRSRLALKGKQGYYLKARSQTLLGEKATQVAGISISSVDLDNGYLPKQLWEKTRGYIEKVCYQINGCYQYEFYDGAAVLIRRLFETLLIEVYEHLKRESEIKDEKGNYLMLEGLISCALSQSQGIPLGKAAKKALGPIKDKGNLSAHNRRYNAIKPDLKNIQQDVRVALEELVNIAKLK